MLLSKIARSFSHALAGLWWCIKGERNFRIHLVAVIVVSIFAYLYRLDRGQCVLLTLTVTGVIVAELFNTAMEAAVDLITKEPHPLAKIAKDVAATGVLVAALCAVVCAGFVFGRWAAFVAAMGRVTASPWNVMGVVALIVVCYLFIRGEGGSKHV